MTTHAAPPVCGCIPPGHSSACPQFGKTPNAAPAAGEACGCAIVYQPVPPVGIRLLGAHGEVLELGVSEVLTEGRVPRSACAAFRAAVLRAFGVGGSRRLGELEETWDGVEGLGPMGDLGGARTIPALGILPK